MGERGGNFKIPYFRFTDTSYCSIPIPSKPDDVQSSDTPGWTQPDPAPWFNSSAGALEAARQGGERRLIVRMALRAGRLCRLTAPVL